MTITEALKFHDDAAILLSFVLKRDKAFLFTYPEKPLTRKQEQKFRRLVKQRSKGMPVAYLTGKKEFFGLEFFLNRHVLIPRPETEGLVELILGAAFVRSQKSGAKILDLGTGSGCIIITLANRLGDPESSSGLRFFASDISKAALKVAQKNAKRHSVEITFKQGDLLKPWLARRSLGAGGKNQRFDVVVANLPYLAKQTASTKFEPKNALVAKKQGLELIEKLIRQIRSHSQIRPFADSIFLEFDPRQETKIKTLAASLLPGYKIKFFRDLAGLPRFARFTSS